MWQFLYWTLLAVAVVVVVLPESPVPVRLIAALLAFLAWYLFRAAAPALGRTSRRAMRRPFTNFGATPAELDRLHHELLMQVGGDERVVRRLVSRERPKHKTAAECYRAAIYQLVRDRR